MDIFTLFGRIAINNSDAISAIDDTSNRASKLSAVFGKVGSAAVAVGKVMAKGLAVGAAGVAALTTNSVKQYAEYEQLVGGVETLFKDSSATVMQYANNAFKTAGLSANEYMATVTSFSASLLQSLGGDTEAAAKVADLALTDMADNANKMGTSMEMIQNAYQGFAKQNYTMLDNLKLGYGGTKTEMQRLLKDAQKLSGVKYDIRNLNDVYEAIHVIQTEMGITGTTALEASETISGSWASMSSAWTNLVVGIADDSQDLNRLIDNFADSAVTAFTNISQRIPSIVTGINKLIEGIAPQIPGLIQNLLPVVLDGAVSLITGLATVIPDILPILFNSIGNALGQLYEAIRVATADMLMEFGIKLPTREEAESAISNWWTNTGLPAVQSAQTFVTDLASALNSVSDWCVANKGVVTAFLGAAAIALAAVSLPLALVAGGLLLLAANWDLIKKAATLAWEAVKTFFGETVPQAWNDMVASVKAWWNENVITPINDSITAIGTFFSEQVPAYWKQFVDDIKAKWGEVTAWIDNSATAVLSFFGIEMPSDWSLTGSIVEAWNSVISAIQSAISAVSEFLGLSSSGGSDVFSDHSAYKGGHGQAAGYRMNGEGGSSASSVAFDNATPYNNSKIPGFATGLDFVPRDNYLARLHYGEAVLTRSEADAWRNGGDGGNIKQVQQLTASVQQLVDDLPDMLVNAFASMKFDVNNRELARLVKAVN